MSSSACTVCGSKQTKIMDGLMYCEVCGTQIFDFREVEADEDQFVSGFGKIRTKKVREEVDKSIGKTDFVALGLSTATAGKKRKGEALRSQAQRISSRDTGQERSTKLSKDITSGRERAPSYLRCVGTRLTAFTKILAKGVAQIKRDSAVPEGFVDHTFAIYQRYLSVCNVAFTPNDYTDDLEKMFRALVLNTNIAFERAREKKAKLERRKKRGKEALQKSLTAWDLLMGDTLDENLELRSDDEQIDDEEPSNQEPSTSTIPSEPRMVSVVDTKIPKEVLENASSLCLAMDVLVAILYVSVVTIGCRWIVLSDIIRWIREDRMGISLFQRNALDYANIQGSKKSKTGGWAYMDLPLYEFQRTALFIWQLCRLPPTPAKIDFKQVVARMLYHVNLPEAMLERVSMLMNAAPPCTRLDEESLRRQGRIEQGPYANGFNAVGEKFSLSLMLHVFGRMKRHRSDTFTDIFFSTETKAFAFILMALKLSFGLDDCSEVAISEKLKGGSHKIFNFMEWFYQLKMRMMFWEGYDPLDILQMSRPVEPLYYENEFPRGENTHFYVHSNQDGKNAYAIRHYARDSEFTHCVPSKIRIDSSTSIPNPFPEYTYDAQSNRNDDESLYVPLRSQENVLRAFLMRPRTSEEKQEIRTMVDEEAVKVFKANYEKCELAEGTSSGDCGEAGSTSSWSRFPCAKNYKRYPRPNWTNGGVIHLKENDERLRRLNRRMGLHTKNSGLRMLFASRKGAMDAWRTARTAMSQTFASLIHWFSKIIGEAEVVLYAAFMILEMQIVDRKKFEELNQSMIDGRIYPIKTTKLHKNGDRTYKTHYVSAAEDVSEAHEVDMVRIGLPTYWESGINEADLTEDSEDLDYTSDSSISTYSDSESSDLSEEEIRARIGEYHQGGFRMRKGMEIDSRVDASLNSGISKPATAQREPLDHQCDVRAFDFDTVWMLVAMRYW